MCIEIYMYIYIYTDNIDTMLQRHYRDAVKQSPEGQRNRGNGF